MKRKKEQRVRDRISVYSWTSVSVVIECIFNLIENTFTDNKHGYESALGDMERNWNDNNVNKKRQQRRIFERNAVPSLFHILSVCRCCNKVANRSSCSSEMKNYMTLQTGKMWKEIKLVSNAQQCDWTVVELNILMLSSMFSQVDFTYEVETDYVVSPRPFQVVSLLVAASSSVKQLPSTQNKTWVYSFI